MSISINKRKDQAEVWQEQRNGFGIGIKRLSTGPDQGWTPPAPLTMHVLEPLMKANLASSHQNEVSPVSKHNCED